MLKGIGTDILELKKLHPIFSTPDYLNDPFILRTFTRKEIALAQSRSEPIYCFATRFAGKEAVFKALNLNGADARLSEIEILSDEYGKPYVHLYGLAKETAQKREISQILVSLSFEDHYAIAFATAS